MKHKPQIIAIVGPTASGKTALAIRIAKQLDTEIISADSRQFYKELPIGSAMPSPEELNTVPHHFINCRSVTEPYTAGRYAEDARKIIDGLLKKHEQVVVCGGSGLYIQALLYPMDDFPDVDELSKQKVEDILQNDGIGGLQTKLKELDPTYFSEVDQYNTARLRRALEVCLASGKPYSAFRTQGNKALYSFSAYGINLPKSELHTRIHQRVDNMIAHGLETEARNVIPYRNQKALQTVGYSEFFDYFDGKISHEQCIDLIKTHTRQYAKRQMTWFRRQLPVEWHDNPKEIENIFLYPSSSFN